MPRLLEIIYEINRRFLDDVRARFPGRPGGVSRVSLIAEGPEKRVRMANLAIVGTHSTNGVAEIHTRLLRTTVVADLAEIFPERFNNKTNGVTPRRWLLLANPDLSRLITDAIGDGWVTDLSQLEKIVPLADDPSFRDGFRQAKHAAKARFAAWLKKPPGSPSTPTPSSIARSSGFMNTNANYSMSCTLSFCIIACATTPSSTCLRGLSSSPARPRRRTRWPS